MTRFLTILYALLAFVGVLTGQPVAAQNQAVDAIHSLIEQAEPGSVVHVPPGVYEGNLVIDKPIVLEGGDQAIIDGLGQGSVVEIRAEGCAFRGFLVRNSASGVDREPSGIRVLAGNSTIENNRLEDVLFGIDLQNAPNSKVLNNEILGKDLGLARRGDGLRLWWSLGCTIKGNTVKGLRDMVFWYSEDLDVSDNRVSDSRYGLHFMYSHHTSVHDNNLSENAVGIYLMYSNTIDISHNTIRNNRGVSGYGIGLKDCDSITISSNALLANRVGIYVDNSPSAYDSTGLISDNMVAFNEIGLLATPITHNNIITHNAFLENEEQAAAHGGGNLSLNSFASDGIGNFWSDYAGYDKDGDGIGDIIHEPKSLFRSLIAREPNLRLFVHSPAQQAIELTARALPELNPKPIFVDPTPLTRVPDLTLPSDGQTTTGAPMGVLAVVLLTIACGSGWLVFRQQPFPNVLPTKVSHTIGRGRA